ncbi:MFS transporter [Limnohabitans sp.]|uniref:MFS transporter n=1 Tax=Limnohabitans sp. TaxID=1907725 RepID=UPI0038BC71A1
MNLATPAVLWCFLFGNFVIGFGVLMVPGSLNDISRDLQISVAQAGGLITAGSVLICLSAPVFASILGKYDRRQLLGWIMLWYGFAHALCVLMPSFEGVLWLRVMAMIAPAIFTPQAAACIGLLTSPAERGRAITFVFLGWSTASVLGMPAAAWIGEVFGWRVVFSVLSLLACFSAAWVWLVLPKGLSPPVMSLSAWRKTWGSWPLMMTVGVTVLSASGQFVLTAYFAPYFKQTLDTSPHELSLLFAIFGAFGLMGNMLMSRHIDRWGAAKAVNLCLIMMSVSLLLWSLGSNFWLAAMILIPWGLGMFACNSAQQARLIQLAPALASGSAALNTSAIYLGQAIGSAAGGWLISHGAMNELHWFGWMGVLLALGLSLQAARLARPLDVSRSI